MQVDKSLSTCNIVNASLSIRELSDRALAKRDVILLNPIHEGKGDRALANKIANIVLNQGGRVVIFPVKVDGGDTEILEHVSLSLRDSEFTIESLHQPVIIMVPVNIMDLAAMETHIQWLCDTYQLPKNDVILIEEMDLLVSRGDFDRRIGCLKKIGFKEITPLKLGFDEGSIGYLPVDENTTCALKLRFECELAKLIDSLNGTLQNESSYHLAYISSSAFITASQLFVFNALVENRNDSVETNFILVIRQLENDNQARLLGGLQEILSFNKENSELDYDANALTRETRLYMINEKGSGLSCVRKFSGKGDKKVNIILVKELPVNIFQDFICLAKSGMASGDQSLSEFLSLSGKLPFYDMQHFKMPLVDAINKIGYNIGGTALKDWLATRVVGRKPFSGEIFGKMNLSEHPVPSAQFDASLVEFNRYLSSRTASEAIMDALKK